MDKGVLWEKVEKKKRECTTGQSTEYKVTSSAV